MLRKNISNDSEVLLKYLVITNHIKRMTFFLENIILSLK